VGCLLIGDGLVLDNLNGSLASDFFAGVNGRGVKLVAWGLRTSGNRQHDALGRQRANNDLGGTLPQGVAAGLTGDGAAEEGLPFDPVARAGRTAPPTWARLTILRGYIAAAADMGLSRWLL
jgi:hypothetical protein